MIANCRCLMLIIQFFCVLYYYYFPQTKVFREFKARLILSPHTDLKHPILCNYFSCLSLACSIRFWDLIDLGRITEQGHLVWP